MNITSQHQDCHWVLGRKTRRQGIRFGVSLFSMHGGYVEGSQSGGTLAEWTEQLNDFFVYFN